MTMATTRTRNATLSTLAGTVAGMMIMMLMMTNGMPTVAAFTATVTSTRPASSRSVLLLPQRPQSPPQPVLMATSSSSSSSVQTEQIESEQAEARKLFDQIDTDGSGAICETEFGQGLASMGLQAKPQDVQALFLYLDEDGNGEISFDEFWPWYQQAMTSVKTEADLMQTALLQQRRTTHDFSQDPVDRGVLRRAVECAIAAPNHHLTEPWNFYELTTRDVIDQIAKLQAQLVLEQTGNSAKANAKERRWREIPGWCVVTTKLSPHNDDRVRQQEDYAAVCCAVQNFCLSMASEGVGTKWTSGPVTRSDEFATLLGISPQQEQVVACVWYGFPKQQASSPPPRAVRKRGVDDVLQTI